MSGHSSGHDVAVLRAHIEAALKSKNLDDVVKYTTQLKNQVLSSPSPTPKVVGDLTQYLATINKKYNQLLKKDVDTHVRVGNKSLRAVIQWLKSGDGMAEFKDEFFNEEKINKMIEDHKLEGEEGDEGRVEEVQQDLPEDVEVEEAEQETPTMSTRRAVREWSKCEQEAEYLRHPKFAMNADVSAYLATHTSVRSAAIFRIELAAIQLKIRQCGAARRYARVRVAAACGEPALVLRHYESLRADATRMREEHPQHPASLLFAEQLEGLVKIVEERKPALEAMREAEKERRMRGIKDILKDTRESLDGMDKAFKDSKHHADAVVQQHKDLKAREGGVKDINVQTL